MRAGSTTSSPGRTVHRGTPGGPDRGGPAVRRGLADRRRGSACADAGVHRATSAGLRPSAFTGLRAPCAGCRCAATSPHAGPRPAGAQHGTTAAACPRFGAAAATAAATAQPGQRRRRARRGAAARARARRCRRNGRRFRQRGFGGDVVGPRLPAAEAGVARQEANIREAAIDLRQRRGGRLPRRCWRLGAGIVLLAGVVYLGRGLLRSEPPQITSLSRRKRSPPGRR